MKKLLCASVLLACASVSQAQTTTNSNITNSATVVSSCTIAVVQDLNFGAFNPLDETNKEGQGLLRLNCTNGSYQVSLSRGSNAVSDATRENNPCTRRMTSADKQSYIGYELNYDGWRTTTTSCQMTTVKTIAFTQSGAQDIPVVGRFVGARKYANLVSGGLVLSDIVTATVTF